MYYIRPKAVNGNDAKIYEQLVITNNGIPKNIKFDYSFNDTQTDLSVNLLHYIDLGDNINVVYDFSRNDMINGYEIIENLLLKDISFTNITANNIYNIQVKSKYTNNNDNLVLTSTNHFDISYSTLSYSLATDNSYNDVNFNEVFSFYSFLENPILEDIQYENDDNLHVKFTIPKTPRIPDKFDISFSNISTNNTNDIFYNVQLTDISNNHTLLGTDYYPGDYNIRVRAKYGNLDSDWSNIKSVNIPQHKPKNFTITYNSGKVDLSWEKPGDFKEILTYSLIKIVRDDNDNEKEEEVVNNNISNTTISDNNITTSNNFIYYKLNANYI